MGSIVEKSKLNLHVRSCVRVDDKLYFSEAYFNGLFQMDLNDFSVKFICHFSEENKGRLLLHGGHAIRYRDVIYFFPTCIKRIHYYNLITGEENNISLPPIRDEKEFAVSGILQKDNRIWLFSAELLNGVFVLDAEKNRITKAEILSKLLVKYDKVTNFIAIPEEGKLFTYCAADFKLLEINVEKEQIKEYSVPTENANIIAINYHEGKFYFIDGLSGDLYEWEWNNMCLRKFEAQDVEMGLVKGFPFSNCCFVDDDIYMIPCRSKYVMRIEKGKGIMKRAFDYPEDFQYMESVQGVYKPSVMLRVEIIRSEIWFYPYGGNQLLIYDTKSGQIIGKKITIDIKEVFPCEGMVLEKDQEVLEYFCHGIKKAVNDVASKDFQVGEKIYKEIRQ